MNNQRRKQIQNANKLLEQAKSILESVLSDEEMAYDNMPENLQGSDRGIASEEAIDVLNDVIDQLSDIMY